MYTFLLSPALLALAGSQDENLATETDWILTCVTCGPEALLHVVINSGLLPPLLQRFVAASDQVLEVLNPKTLGVTTMPELM